jgi:enamine deaminase RidA (YjgF/YER057c/UK114 family)
MTRTLANPSLPHTLRLAAATALALSLLGAAAAPGQAAERVAYPSTAMEGLPYSGVVRAGGTVHVGGVLGTLRNKPELVPGGITPETRQSLTYVKEMLELAGSSLDRTYKCIVLLADIDDFPAMNAVFREFFPKDPPTRSTIIVPEIPLGAAVEVDCDALAGD